VQCNELSHRWVDRNCGTPTMVLDPTPLLQGPTPLVLAIMHISLLFASFEERELVTWNEVPLISLQDLMLAEN
jgi:hypothetical protein